MKSPTLWAVRFACMVLGLVIGLPASAVSATWDVGGHGSVDVRYFPYGAAHPGQKNMTISPSGSLNPDLAYDFGDNDRLTLEPFMRLDGDDKKRTHFDLREFNWQHLGPSWDVSVGISKVFWGVTESVHLVDIINQTDFVEDISGEEKLGQPMVNLNIEQSWGTVNLFLLPGFRERTFTSDHARLHGPLAIDSRNSTYESARGQGHVDWAARWSVVLGDMDASISHFQGTSREPLLLRQHRAGQSVLVPHYKQIGQTGMELQLTTDNTLWKAEMMTRRGHGKRFYAGVGGLEHTLYGVAGSVADVGLLIEYLYDGRDPLLAPPSFADHDLFAGFRVAMNDTQDSTILLGGSWDYRTDAGFINLEAERRLTDHIKLEIKGRSIVNTPDIDPASAIKSDDFLELTVNYFF
ncbi:MAG: hypothetical protein R8K49_02990 [Mariprofundaceae bacterium]